MNVCDEPETIGPNYFVDANHPYHRRILGDGGALAALKSPGSEPMARRVSDALGLPINLSALNYVATAWHGGPQAVRL